MFCPYADFPTVLWDGRNQKKQEQKKKKKKKKTKKKKKKGKSKELLHRFSTSTMDVIGI